MLVYASDEESPFGQAARDLLSRADRGEFQACLAPQVLFEFYSTVTDSRRVRHAIAPRDAAQAVHGYLVRGYRMVFPGSATVPRAVRLASEQGMKGGDVYDCVLAATALDNDVNLIYTANPKDFRFPGLRAVNPLSVIA